MKKFGKAKDFYRARIISFKLQDVENLDWADDILYQSPMRRDIKPKFDYQLQIISIDNSFIKRKLNFQTQDHAKEDLEQLSEDLEMLTKKEFEVKYFKPAKP